MCIRDRGEDLFDVVEQVPSPARPQDLAYEAAELQQDVRRLIGTLPRKLRDALLLAGTGEHTYDDIAEMLATPVGTVKWRVAEARRVLKRKLSAMGYRDE